MVSENQPELSFAISLSHRLLLRFQGHRVSKWEINYDRLQWNRRLPVIKKLVDLLLVPAVEQHHQYCVTESAGERHFFRTNLGISENHEA